MEVYIPLKFSMAVADDAALIYCHSHCYDYRLSGVTGQKLVKNGTSVDEAENGKDAVNGDGC